MSDWIEQDGKRYYEQGYLELANKNTQRAKEEVARFQSLVDKQAAEIELLANALIAGLEWSEAIEQGPFSEVRSDLARVEFHRLAKGLVECGHLVNLGHLAKSEALAEQQP